MTRAGQAWLHHELGLRVPPPFVVSSTGSGARRTHETAETRLEHYPQRYAPEPTAVGHLRFALKNEPVDTGVLHAAFRAIGPEPIEAWVRTEPNSAYARRAWFLYEFLVGKGLDLPDAGTVTYVPALDDALQMTAEGRPSRRHKVTDNMLGVPGFAPTVRRTGRLERRMAERLDERAAGYIAEVPREVMGRAVRYLFTKETRSSFEIERERPSPQKAERFVAVLERGGAYDPTDPQALLELQNLIVDPRYAAGGLRDFQNFVGESLGGYRERVHFVCPRPGDVPDLMSCWSGMTRRLRDGADPVTAATLSAFGFVFIHPFEDGNGRLHRFLVHHVLARRGFSPPGAIFPVSAAILRDAKGYDAALEAFSRPVLGLVDWTLRDDQSIEVRGATDHLYRYFDATPQVEFLYDRIADTVDVDLRQEIEFVLRHDRALASIARVVDMPDKRAALLARYLVQGGGTVSKRKRGQFQEITDPELAGIEEAFAELADDPDDEAAARP